MCRRYATLALGSLSANIDNHEFLLSDDQEVTPIPSAPSKPLQPPREDAPYFKAMVATLQVEDLESRFNAAFALGKLAINPEKIGPKE